MTISRRHFLGGLAAGAGVLSARPARGGTYEHFDGYPGRNGLLHDTTLCVGCRSCEKACKQVNQLPPIEAPIDDKAIFERMRRTTDKAYTVVNRYREANGRTKAVFRKHQCMHCNEPCCASVCFVKAFTKTPEGPVLYNPDVCVGCRYCMTACPYHALAYTHHSPTDPKVVRCTMCYPRIKQGKNPGCSDACPMGAITFGRRDELLQVARARIAKFPERYINHVFGENEFGGTSWLFLAGIPFKQLGLHEGVTHTPLPEFTTPFLSIVPLVLTMWPGLFLGIYAFSRRKERLADQQLKAAVADALAKADAETKAKLAAAAERAKKDKEKAVAAAVKKAVAEAQQKEGSK